MLNPCIESLLAIALTIYSSRDDSMKSNVSTFSISQDYGVLKIADKSLAGGENAMAYLNICCRHVQSDETVAESC